MLRFSHVLFGSSMWVFSCPDCCSVGLHFLFTCYSIFSLPCICSYEYKFVGCLGFSLFWYVIFLIMDYFCMPMAQHSLLNFSFVYLLQGFSYFSSGYEGFALQWVNMKVIASSSLYTNSFFLHAILRIFYTFCVFCYTYPRFWLQFMYGSSWGVQQ